MGSLRANNCCSCTSPPAERALLKQQWELDRHRLRFIALSPFLVMAHRRCGAAPCFTRRQALSFVKAPDANTFAHSLDAWRQQPAGQPEQSARRPAPWVCCSCAGLRRTPLRVNGTAASWVRRGALHGLCLPAIISAPNW